MKYITHFTLKCPGVYKRRGQLLKDLNIDGLVQERCSSSALAMEFCLSCTKPWVWPFKWWFYVVTTKWKLILSRNISERSLKSFHLETVWVLDIENLPVMTTAGGWVDWREFNSLAAGKFEWNFRYVIFKWILVIDGWGISFEVVILWMSLDFTDDQSTLVHVMAWCHQATSHYLIQCWPRSVAIWCH